MRHIELPTGGGYNVWTTVWPTTEGVYWFWGYPWGQDGLHRATKILI